ncbi:hypothetical protein GCM10007100_19430 [Roseibacillus persicicus]|uniref:HTH araC/xylS-type domain-containing protein n=2 Tax=Roseibacillus persicicus TaxID=454148 RepID=A0A918WL68_9BACT|nr:hypothetical protein GCM10007100_19430 [Roseibacillus persicicus]
MQGDSFLLRPTALHPMNTTTNAAIHETALLFRHQKLVERLQGAAFFQSYSEVFQQMTGLPLELHPVADQRVQVCGGSVNQNRFCHLVNRGEGGCAQCLMSQRCLGQGEARSRVQSISCFAGLQETAVPLVYDGRVIAQLKTGQIFHEQATEAEWNNVQNLLQMDPAESKELEEAYLATPVMEKGKYRAMVTLLAAFSLQLGKLLNRLALEIENEEGNLVARAKNLIEEHLTESLALDDLAENLGVSPFHLCRKFKEGTGETLTLYLTSRRVELAKEALLKGESRITDIAYEVGFQSLSQFNRSFHKITGMNPTEFRRQEVAA